VSQPLERLAAFDPIGARHSSSGAGASGRYLLLDVFSERPLEGNQLAVFTDARGIEEEQMQRLARELGLSETVFVLPAQQGGEVAIRIFTPAVEMPFAGHPVLGTAIVVASALQLEAVTLETQMGPVSVRVRHEDGLAVSGWMAQPVPSWAPFEREQELLRALGVARATLPVEVYDNGPQHVLVALESPEVVTGLGPDLQALASLGKLNVSCFGGAGRHWRTRMFAPALGVPEDPATGSAAGPLALHLARHGLIAFGEEIEISQGSEISRPSLLYAFAAGSAERVQSVEVGGSAVIVAGGEFLLG
jgi:trans-2,3-dihydro-3-hydroxyanthranilate isomerase